MSVEGVSTNVTEAVQPSEQTDFAPESQVAEETEATADHGGDSVRGEPDLIASIWRHRVEADYEQQVVGQTAPPSTDEGPATEAETGAEAAARLSNADNPAYQGPEGENNRANDFAAVIHLHQDDQAFLAEMFQSLGPEQSAQLVARSSNLGEATLYDSEGEEVATFDATSTVARGLSLADRSLSSQWDQRFAQAAARDERTALAVSDVLGNSGMEAGYLQRVFLNEVMRSDRALSATSGDRAQSRANLYARAAGEVLAENPALAHEYLGKNGRLTVEQRGQLIRNAAYLGYNGTGRDGFDRAIANLSPDDL